MKTTDVRNEELSEPETATHQSLDTFKSLIHKIFTRVRANGSSLSESENEAIHSTITELLYHFEEAVRDEQTTSESKDRLIEYVQREFFPYLMMSENARRWYEKPEGYPGDYVTMRRLYEREIGGIGMIGTAMDRTFLDIPPAVAVRNRRQFLSDQLAGTVEEEEGQTNVLSLACGPAVEVFDVLGGTEDESVSFNLLDMDPGAIQYVEKETRQNGEWDRIETFRRNLIFIVKGRHTLPIDSQNLIYSAGLIDYFEKDFVVELLDWGYEKLAPGGRMILGNFHPDNTNRAFMDHILRWELNHRRKQDMHELGRTSRFDRNCSNLWVEENGINLFAEYEKH